MGHTLAAARIRLNSVKVLVACVLTLFAPLDVKADSWAAPRIRESFSESREYFVRVIPGESIGDVTGFAGSKKGKYAHAEFYRRDKNRLYKLTAETILFNPVAPVEFFVSDGGRLVTVDNWHNVGYGNVVSIYDSKATLIRTYQLSGLFEIGEIKNFPHSVSSIHWRNGTYLHSSRSEDIFDHGKKRRRFPFRFGIGKIPILREPGKHLSLSQ